MQTKNPIAEKGPRPNTYPNPRAEMARRGLTSQRLAQALRLNPGTLSAKLNDPSRLRLDEAFLLRDRFFPGESVEYLFDRHAGQPPVPEDTAC